MNGGQNHGNIQLWSLLQGADVRNRAWPLPTVPGPCATLGGRHCVHVLPRTFETNVRFFQQKCVNGSRPPLWVWGEDGNDVFVDHVFVDEFLNHRRLTGNFGSHFACKDLPSTAKHQADHRACADLFALYMFNLPGLSSHPQRHGLWLGSLTTAGRCLEFPTPLRLKRIEYIIISHRVNYRNPESQES